MIDRGPEFTLHAIDRYIERVKPGLSPSTARDELDQLVRSCGVYTMVKPDWLDYVEPETEAFLMLGEDIAFPLTNGVAATCLARGGLAVGKRRHLTRAKRQRAAAKRAAGSRPSHAFQREQKGQPSRARARSKTNRRDAA